MEFLKKYWSKLVLATISVVGAILMIVPLFTMPKFQFLGFCQIFGIVLFFLGMATYYILKMCEVKKLVAAIALLTTGVLSTLALVVGSFGFIYTKEIKADTKPEDIKYTQGIFGQMYYLGDSSTREAREEGDVAFFNEVLKKADIKSSKKLKDITADDFKSVQDKAKAFAEKYADKEEYTTNVAKAAGLQLLTVEYYKTLAISAATAFKYSEGKAPTQAQIDALTWGNFLSASSATYKGELTLALVVLYTYISLILVMGLVPAVVGTKKLVCALGKCDCCGNSAPVKAAAAPVAYSAPAPVAAPAAPVAKPAAPKAPKTK